MSAIYWALCYVDFFCAFIYLIGFVGNRYTFSTLDSGLQLPFHEALRTDVLLLLLFFAQHSIMARPWFKRWWRRWLPASLERSSYVLASSLVLVLIFRAWEPMPELVWRFEHPLAVIVLHALFWAGWLTVIVSSFIAGHWELVGLRQAIGGGAGRGLRVAGPYRWMRHPMIAGLLLGFWSTPEMSRGHLLFAGANLAYALVAVRWEERDLAVELGAEYEKYRREVPRWLPGRRDARAGRRS
jgi:protein-S-isoprenylcysteine O-methyltransferase Ste14